MKKYSNLHNPLVERVLNEEPNEKAAKTKLHQLYGAYIQPNSIKKAAVFLQELEVYATQKNGMVFPEKANNMDLGINLPNGFSEACTSILKLHSSTRERLPYMHEFYGFIKTVVGEVSTVLDLGCGFNPFSLNFFPWNIREYHAIDIDNTTRDLLNLYFAQVNLPGFASCADLITETPKTVTDMALMLKLLPVLEANKPGRGYRLADSLKAKWLVITFPTKSLGGKNKGMAKNYGESFHGALENNRLGNFSLCAENRIGSELVFVLESERRRT